jgi:PAS domain S-box-containing protein
MNIKQKLITLLLFISLVPSLTVGTIAYATISNDLTESTAYQLASVAIKQEQKINALLQQKQEEVIKLSNKYDFQIALGEYLRTKSRTDRNKVTTLLQATKTEVPDMQSIYVTDAAGVIIAATTVGEEDKKLDTADYFAVKPGEETSTTVHEDSRDGINKLYINTKISVNQQSAGVLSVVYRIDDIVAAIQDYTGLGVTGETVIAEKDDNGEAISLLPLRFDTDAALQTNLSTLHLFDTSGSYTYQTDYRGREVMVVPRSIGFADWAIATKIDKEEAFAPIYRLRNSLIGIFTGCLLAFTLIAFLLARVFTEPILHIARTAKRIGQGDFSARIGFKRKDEFGALGNSIDAMGLSLKEFVSSIEAQRNRLQIILNSTTESILAIDKAGSIIIANQAAAALTGREAAQLVGKNIRDVFTWKQDTQPFTIDYSAPGTHTYPDLQYTDPADNTHFVKLIIGRVTGEQTQQAAQTIITIHDETKSRELENMKIDFVSMAAHELRTPLAAIRGYLELIRYKEADALAPSAQKYLQQSLKSSAELGGLINNLLDVTRIERGTLALHMEKVDLAACVYQAIQDARFAAEERKINLSYTGVAEGCSVVGDPIALREVINNLVSNAIKYTLPGGQAHVSLKKENDRFVVRVQDTGIGIAKQALPNLFTKFFRVHGGLDSGSTGTGLGLFISKSIIERHEGTISVESEESAGSVFTFTLPELTEARLTASQASEPQEIERRHRGWVTKNTTR